MENHVVWPVNVLEKIETSRPGLVHFNIAAECFGPETIYGSHRTFRKYVIHMNAERATTIST